MSPSRTIKPIDIEAFEAGDFSPIKRRKITPEDLRRIQNACDEIGALGEQFVLEHERARLRRLGHLQAANQVERISLQSVGEGYDISSFEDDGHTPRYLEVKSTIGNGFMVDISAGEWKAAKKLRSRYYLVRVVKLRNTPKLFFFKDPSALVDEMLISRTETGWRLDLRKALIQLSY